MHKDKLLFAIAATAIVLLALAGIAGKKPQVAMEEKMKPVPCLAPNMPLKQHLHAMLQIVINGVPATLPKDIGISASCEHALHTHDTTGTMHVEAQDARAYTLGDFFSVWGRPLVTANFVSMTVNGRATTGDPAKLVLEDKQQIIVSYKAPEGKKK